MKKKILITGASGFIGRNLKEKLETDSHYRIVAPISSELDILDSYAVFDFLKKNKFDTIIHCATHNATRISTKDLSKVFYSNLRMFFNLVRCNNLFGRMFYFGSGAEYDMNHYIPRMKEDYFDRHVPKDDYGFSKYIMAQYVQNCSNIYDLRLFGVFGKYEDWRIRFISNAVCRVLFDKNITISQNVYFDYMYIDDLAYIMKILLGKQKLKFHYYNVCSGTRVDLRTLAEKVLKISKSKKNKKIIISKRGLKREYSGDNERLLKEIGKFQFTPMYSAIEKLYQYYQQNRFLIDKSML